MEGRQVVVAAEVYQDGVREGRAGLRAPIGAFLKVEGLLAGTVGRGVFAVGVHYFPPFARNTLAVAVEQVEFRYRSDVVASESVEHLYHKVAAASGFREVHLLPACAVVKLTFRYRYGIGEVWHLVEAAQSVAEPEAVDYGLFQATALGFARSEDVEDKYLVLTLPEPATGCVERLLRTYFPDAAEGMAVDVYESFAPGGEVEEGIGGFDDVEGAAVDAACHAVLRGGACGVAFRFGYIPECHGFIRFVSIGDEVDVPVAELAGEGIAVAVFGDAD